jgi:hypothetical protein
MVEKLLVGRWRLSKSDPGSQSQFGDHAMEFTPFGDLVYTTFDSERIRGRMLLEYHLKDYILVTDQPSAPREERIPFRIRNDELILGNVAEESIYARENPGASSDPLAYMLAIASFAINHGLNSAHTGSPFVPFLVTDNDQGRSLTRVMANTPEDARHHAQASAEKSQLKACAYTCDGYVTLDQGRFDAVIAEVSQQGLPSGLLLAQAYSFKRNRIFRIEHMSMQENQSWL